MAMSTKANGKMTRDMALENIRLSMELFTKEWRNNKNNGFGKYTWANGDVTRANGKTTFAWQGKMTKANGEQYIGKWKTQKDMGLER